METRAAKRGAGPVLYLECHASYCSCASAWVDAVAGSGAAGMACGAGMATGTAASAFFGSGSGADGCGSGSVLTPVPELTGVRCSLTGRSLANSSGGALTGVVPDGTVGRVVFLQARYSSSSQKNPWKVVPCSAT